jgi:catechol 2,3-dioxygenase-like lactoylglutathione lyase family enzyme
VKNGPAGLWQSRRKTTAKVLPREEFAHAEARWLPEHGRSSCRIARERPSGVGRLLPEDLGNADRGRQRTRPSAGGDSLLCSRPDEESHEIALFTNPIFAHVAFKVTSHAEWQAIHAKVVERGIPIQFAFNHGVSLAFYFPDPDGHLIEVYYPTGALDAYRQPYAEPLDVSKADEVLQQIAHAPA